jgi:hypothetical protein
VHVWRLDPVPRIEGEAEALDPKEYALCSFTPLPCSMRPSSERLT